LWGPDLHDELRHALHSTAAPVLSEDSLCCGGFGRAAILRLGATHDQDGGWLDAAVELEAQMLSRRRAAGGYSFKDVPGLFQGAAGAGLALLDSVPHAGSSLVPTILSAGLHADEPRKFEQEALRMADVCE
jgi:lantibiotic modifying enzyme